MQTEAEGRLDFQAGEPARSRFGLGVLLVGFDVGRQDADGPADPVVPQLLLLAQFVDRLSETCKRNAASATENA